MLENLAQGIYMAAHPQVLLLTALGVIFGIILGAIPGLTAVLGITLLLPLTYGLPAATGFAMLMGIYVGGISGGLISATLLGLPGTPSSIATTFDGYPMAKKGFPGKALGMGTTASLIGTIFSWLALILMAPALAKLALKFGPFEYAALIVFALTTVVSLTEGSLLKGLFTGTLGFLLATVGIDPLDGFVRFTGGLDMFEGGIQAVPALIGLLVLGETFAEVGKNEEKLIFNQGKLDRVWITLKELLPHWFNFLRSSVIGLVIGILPGIGGSVANLVCYDVAKKNSKNPEEYGRGCLDGIIASETGNNATIGGALIPMLTLGIPGDNVTAILLGGLILHGLQPGPFLFRDHPEFVYTIFGALLISGILMYVFQMTVMIRAFKTVLKVPKYILAPVVIVMAIAGSYNLQYRVYDVYITVIFGLAGYLLKRGGVPLTPMVISLLLGTTFERYFRSALMASGGSYSPFITRPISILFLVLAIISIYVSIKKGKKYQANKQNPINS